MERKPQKITYSRLLFPVVLLAGYSQAVHADIDSSSLCNKGSTSIYFATVGEHDGFIQSGAMVQGLVEVAPDTCENLVPDGMNKVILTFFTKDSRGILTNKLLVPTNATRVNSSIEHVCVNMTQPYRLFGSKEAIFSSYVNASCPTGFSPAIPAWIHQPGGTVTYNIEVNANGPEAPWRDTSGKQFTNPPVLRVGPLQSAGPLIQVNQSSLHDYQAAQALVKAAKEYKERAEREAQQRQTSIWAEQQRRRQNYEAKVDAAEESLLRPADDVCARYADNKEIRKGADVALSGIRLGMDMKSAHEALICNGYTINAEMLARAGGVEKFWANSREKTFQKKLADGTVVFTDVETRPPRGAPAGADFVVLTVRIRYRLPERLSTSEWQDIKRGFKEQFRIAKRRIENDVVVRMQYEDDVGIRSLQLDAQDFRNGSVSQYSISIL